MRGFIISAGVFFLLNNSFGFAQSDPNRRASALDAYEDNGRRAPDQNGDMNFHGFGGKRSCFVKEPAWIAPSSASRSGGPAPSEQQNPYTWVNGQIQTWISPGELPFGFADASLAGLSNARLFLSESGLERSDPDGRFALRIPTMGGILSTNLVSDHVKVYDRAFIPGDERTSCEIFFLPKKFGEGVAPVELCYKRHEMRFDWTWRDYPFEGTFSDLILGDETQESDVINSNAYIHLNHLQDQVFVKARDLFDWRSINWQKPEIIAFTNTPGECNAIVPIDSYQISFGRASSGRCVNAAYSSVVVHEYAHVLFQSLFHVGSMPWSIWLPPTDLGAYGEGMADALSAITMSTYCMGRKFFADRECGRDLREARRFPIEDGDPHIRGMALSGAWYDLLTLTPAANRQDIALRLYMQTLIQNDQFMGPQLVNYVLQADCELYAGAHLDLIRQAFVINRGFPIDDWGASLTASSCR